MRRTDAAARTLACVATLLTVCAVDATAQLPWESPQLLGPRAPAGFSFIAIDYGLDPSPDLGGSIIYRTANAGAGFGIRGSVAPGFGDRVNVAAGLDLARPLVTASPEFPFDLMWTAGAGGSWGEFLEFALPLGVTLGTSVGTSSVRADPYMSARGAVEGRLGESAFGDRVSLALAVDGRRRCLHRALAHVRTANGRLAWRPARRGHRPARVTTQNRDRGAPDPIAQELTIRSGCV